MKVNKRAVSAVEYEYVFRKESDQKAREVYSLIFDEMENNKGVFRFKFQKYENKK